MSGVPVAARSRQTLAFVAARFIVVCAAVGLGISFIARKGGGDHSCPAGSSHSSCTYPTGPWHWGEGLLIGALVGVVVFTAWYLVQRIADR